MALGCGAKCAKVLLIVLNLVFWVAGVALLGLGVWIHVDYGKAHLYHLVTIDTVGIEVVAYFKYFLIGLGGVVFVVSFIGCCGACKENKCMLGTYFCFLLLVFLAFAAVGILAVTSQATLLTNVEKHLKRRLTHYYNQTGSEPFTVAIDFVQVEYECCGIAGSRDFINSEWRNSSYGKLPEAKQVPFTCCVLHNEYDRQAFLHPQPKNSQLCQSEDRRVYATTLNGGPFRYEVGCWDSVGKWFQLETTVIMCGALGVAGLLIFGMLFALCLCRNVEDDEEEG